MFGDLFSRYKPHGIGDEKMAANIRLTTEVEGTPYLIHTGVMLNDENELKKFIMSNTYKDCVTNSFMDRKKIKVVDFSVTEKEGLTFDCNIKTDRNVDLHAVVECFVFETGKTGGVISGSR